MNPAQGPENGHSDRASLVESWGRTTAARVNVVAGILHEHLKRYWEPKLLSPPNPKMVLPFTTPTVPANEAVLARVIEGYSPPTPDLIDILKSYSSAKENYGTAGGEATAVLVQIAKALQPETAFVIGTGRGRLEQLIGEFVPGTLFVTLDLPTELVGVGAGSPNDNNIRYRKGLGIATDDDIGSLFKESPAISGRVHQILGDSFTFDPTPLAGTMRLTVVDGNHDLPNVLRDLATAVELAHRDGGVIFVDDFKKASPLNMGVDAAMTFFNQVSGLPVFWPCPRPGETGVEAPVAIVVVPPLSKFKREPTIRKLADTVRLLSEPTADGDKWSPAD